MDSDLEQQQYQHHFQPQQRSGGGLIRYRSAPSSYLSSFINTPTNNSETDYSQPRPLSPETESILARFVQSVADGGASSSPSLVVKQETQQQFYHPSSNKPPLARRSSNLIAAAVSHAPPATLARHRSSPVSLFDDVIVQNGLLVSSPKKEEEELIKFPAGNWDELSEQFGGCENQHQNEVAAEEEEEEESRSSSSGVGVGRISALGLGHHMSLPTAASLEKLMQTEIEQGRNTTTSTVGCQLRAKRGCATHPRSIAERVRRTKISERMRKLQDLVPNMDNQTNTADMLDLAVDYIKQLETQILTLRNKRARCTCSSSSINRSSI